MGKFVKFNDINFSKPLEGVVPYYTSELPQKAKLSTEERKELHDIMIKFLYNAAVQYSWTPADTITNITQVVTDPEYFISILLSIFPDGVINDPEVRGIYDYLEKRKKEDIPFNVMVAIKVIQEEIENEYQKLDKYIESGASREEIDTLIEDIEFLEEALVKVKNGEITTWAELRGYPYYINIDF